MSVFWLTLYILIWPVIAAGVLFVLTRAVIADLLKARQDRRDLV